MKIFRQGERRARFLAALNDMPRLETWETREEDAPPAVIATNSYTESMYGAIAVEKKVEIEPPRVRHHVKVIQRRVRRDMARQRSRRDYRRDHDVPEKGDRIR